MNNSLFYLTHRIVPLFTRHSSFITGCAFCFLFSIFCFLPSASAQRLEVHVIKDFSNNVTTAKAWGVGGAVDLDQWVKKTTFRVHFDWAMYRKKDEILNPNYQRMSGGISALYAFNITKKFSFQCGAEVNYTQLKHSYLNGFENNDTLKGKPITLQHIGNFVGIGPHFDLRYELTPRIKVVFNFVPVYLISVSYKVSDKISKPEYKKGVWLFPLQLGFSYQLFKPD